MYAFLIVAVLLSNGVWSQGPIAVFSDMGKCQAARDAAIDGDILPKIFAGLDVREYHAVCVRSVKLADGERT